MTPETAAQADVPQNSSSEVIPIEDLKAEGLMLWARIQGYSYWPGIVTVDPMDGLTVKINDNANGANKKGSRCRVHVHFLGYSNMRAWVPDANVMLYQGKEAYDKVASASPKQKMKDFVPTKKYQRLFEKAIKVAEDTVKLPLEARLKKLGLVYVLIDENEDGKDSSNDSKKVNNGHSNLPKITSGFFKNYQPIITPSAKPEKSSLDVFEFDDEVDQFNVDFRLNTSKDQVQSDEPSSSEKKETNKPAPKKKTQQPKPKKAPVKRKAPMSSSEGNKPKKAKVSKNESKLSVKVTSQSDGAPAITDLQDASSDEEFNSQNYDKGKPLLGSLVWGRMSGFPYWPCFVTKSPDGDFKRSYGKRVEYHAQFFNWNNESGWITGSMPWCPINDYHSKAKLACPKGPNTPEGRNWYPPSRLATRWKAAVLDAQKTALMSRKQRHDSLVVTYGSRPSSSRKNAPIYNSKASKATIEPKELTIPQKQTNVTEASKSTKSEQEEEASTAPRPKSPEEIKDKPCPASKKKLFFRGGLALGKIELPKGWSYELTKTDPAALKFHSPEGIVYDGVERAVAHLLQQNCCPTNRGGRRRRSFSTSSLQCKPQESEDQQGFGWFLRSTDRMHFDMRPFSADQVGQLEGPVEYLKDGSLPPTWSVRTIRSKSMDDVEVLYRRSSTSDEELSFKDKVSVAQFLEGMGHPALEIEQLLFNYPQIAKVAPREIHKDDEPSDVHFTIALSEWSVEEVAKNEILAKTVVPCFIDMVKLPSIFLEHPQVKVQECNNEMIISDSITGVFIAKKIIYD